MGGLEVVPEERLAVLQNPGGHQWIVDHQFGSGVEGQRSRKHAGSATSGANSGLNPSGNSNLNTSPSGSTLTSSSNQNSNNPR